MGRNTFEIDFFFSGPALHNYFVKTQRLNNKNIHSEIVSIDFMANRLQLVGDKLKTTKIAEA